MSTTANFDTLPDNIILDILGYLNVKDLCQSGRVCRRWRRIVRDNKLWRHVDLLPYRLNLQRTWKVIRSHFSECLLSMKIKGFVRTETKSKKPSLSNAILGDLKERCPNIRELHLHLCNTNNLSADSLPSSLTTLVMHHCSWKPRWLKSAHSTLPHLVHLDLSCSSRVDHFDMEDIVAWINLKCLKLNGCYRVNESGLEKLARNLTNLNRLEICGTRCSDLPIHHIARHLTTLTHISLSNCPITDSCLATLADGLKKLQSIEVNDCRQVTVEGIKHLKVCRHLNTIVCGLDEEQVCELELEFPNCSIIIKT